MHYLLDSDFLYGLSISDDAHHENCVKLYKNFKESKPELTVLNLVIQETATVISRKKGQKASLLFLEKLEKLPISILWLGEEDENLAWEVFKKQTKKGTSFIDCANLAIAKKYKFDGILSFDEFYLKTPIIL